MDKHFLCRGKRLDNRGWIYGNLVERDDGACCIITSCIGAAATLEINNFTGTGKFVDPTTVGKCTGLPAAKSYRGNKPEDLLIFQGDITELVLPDGEVRWFKVDIRTVIREVISHPDFDAPTAKVVITGVVFLWNGFELFPCIDGNGVIDTSKMSIVGNIHDHHFPRVWLAITPHKTGTGGILTMPLRANVPSPQRDDWQLTTCPKCGAECWETNLHREMLTAEPDIQAACIKCALKAGIFRPNNQFYGED